MTKEPAGYGSASGAIKELGRIGAVEGIHYRMSRGDEDINDFILAIDNGPMVVTMTAGVEAVKVDGALGAFAVLNPAGMELVGAGVTAAKMRDGSIPAEAVYVLAVK